MQKRQHQAQCKHAYLGIALVYSSCKIQRGMLSFPRMRESIASRSAATDFYRVEMVGDCIFYMQLQSISACCII